MTRTVAAFFAVIGFLFPVWGSALVVTRSDDPEGTRGMVAEPALIVGLLLLAVVFGVWRWGKRGETLALVLGVLAH